MFQQTPPETTFYHFSPNDDSSIPTLGNHTTADNQPESDGESIATNTAHDDDNAAADDHDPLTDDDDKDSISDVSLASRFETFKDGVDKRLDVICNLLQKGQEPQTGDSSGSVKKPASTPDSNKDEGEGPL